MHIILNLFFWRYHLTLVNAIINMIFFKIICKIKIIYLIFLSLSKTNKSCLEISRFSNIHRTIVRGEIFCLFNYVIFVVLEKNREMLGKSGVSPYFNSKKEWSYIEIIKYYSKVLAVKTVNINKYWAFKILYTMFIRPYLEFASIVILCPNQT